MSATIGIRREDKNHWERRVPLVPRDIAHLREKHRLRFAVQPSKLRAFKDEAYEKAGATLTPTLDDVDLVLAVKEIPIEKLEANKQYVYFSHVIKGQPYNMPTLRRLLELGSSLVDYERIADEQGRRLIYFSRHAGYAGMQETLWTLGERLAAEGTPTPLLELKHAYEYPTLEAMKEHLRAVGDAFARLGPPRPLVIGLAGYGNVSRGAQDIFDCLPHVELAPEELAQASAAAAPFVKAVFREEHMAKRRGGQGGFDLEEYYAHPERYTGRFEEHLPFLDVLVNTIYWEPRYPRLVRKAWVEGAYAQPTPPRLRVIGDITCDIDGSIEITHRATEPDNPSFVYDIEQNKPRMGVTGNGPVVMAVDNLPCELPRESSEHFSSALRDLVPELANASWGRPFDVLDLPAPLKRALIVHRGELTPSYRYLERHLDA